jgi:LPXTG-motif cell wall-anchored protein
MKKHTTYYVIGAVLIGVGAYLYGKKKNENNVTVNLNPPSEVKEEDKLPETATPPYVSAYDALKKFLDSLKLGKAETTSVTNQTV